MRRTFLIVVLLIIVSGIGWWFSAPKTGEAPAAGAPAAGGPPQGVAVEAVKVKMGAMAREITAVGSLRSDESVMIRPEIAGRVKAFGFEEGTHVNRGQLLVKLDDASLAADMEQARANLGLSKANAERASRLASQGAGTQRALDEAEAKLRVDHAKVEQARAQLEKTMIVAPFAGTVGLRTVSVGAYVQPGQDIVNLEVIDPLKVDFRVPEVFLALVRQGLTVAITADPFPGRTFPGTVSAIDPAVDQNGRAVLVRARVDNKEGLLRPGQFVRLALKVDESAAAITIPEEAVVPKGEQMMVFKVVDGKAMPTPVKVGKRIQGTVEITEGLVDEDIVVTAGQMKLRPGVPVKVVPAKPEN
ncbi:MAG: efflux RND transporter periplasmic adaptor subunit [Magnetospirillum sp.]|nr:efflux RND transporter periplasmic adaptor subunit [Magnetospirillum sp.]